MARGEGYYGSKKHDKPLHFEEFEQLVNQTDPGLSDAIRIRRHEAYMVSWELYHKEK